MSASIGLTPHLVEYVRNANRPEHPALTRCREETAALGEAARMQMAPEGAAVLQLLVRLINARDAIEVGVFTGYSAVATALAMRERHGDDARLVACELGEDYVRRAQGYAEAAGVLDTMEFRVGPAKDSLDNLLENDESGQFDFAFVDADKTGYGDYYERVIQLLRPGGVMVFDNVLWGGGVADLSKTDADTEALRSVAAKARDDARVDMAFTSLADGLLICVKR